MAEDHGFYGIGPQMNTREILAANLAALRQRHKHLKSTLAIERESAALGEDRKIAHSVMQRVFKAETPFNLDDLQTLAELFGLDAWQLLVPQIDPEHPPVLRSIGRVEDEAYKRWREARAALDVILGEK